MGFHLVRKECIANPLKLLAHLSTGCGHWNCGNEVILFSSQSIFGSVASLMHLAGSGVGLEKVLLRKDLEDSSL